MRARVAEPPAARRFGIGALVIVNYASSSACELNHNAKSYVPDQSPAARPQGDAFRLYICKLTTREVNISIYYLQGQRD